MTAFWQMPYGQDPEDPDAIDVTGFGDPVRSFISREPTAAELDRLRADWESALVQRGPVGAVILPPEPCGIIHRPREPGPAAPDEYDDGPCAGCGTDCRVDAARLCRYCAELGGLRAGQAARALPPRRWHDRPVPLRLLAIVLIFISVWAIMFAITGG